MKEEFRFWILLIQAIICYLSTASSVMIMIFYKILHQNRQSLPFKIVFLIAFTDLILWGMRLAESMDGLLGNGFFRTIKWLCILSGYLQVSLALSNFFLAAVMAYCIQRSIVHMQTDFSVLKKYFYTVAIAIPLFISIPPILTGNYGFTDDVKCWITGGDDDLTGTLERLIVFYIPLISLIFYNLWSVLLVRKALKNRASTAGQTNINRKEQSRLRNQFLYYPLVLIGSYFFSLVHRIIELSDKEIGTGFPVLILHYSSAPLQGFLNAVVYGTTNKEVKRRLLKILCCRCLSEEVRLNEERLSNQLLAENVDRNSL